MSVPGIILWRERVARQWLKCGPPYEYYYRKSYHADPSYVEAGSAYMKPMRSSVMTDTMQSRAEQLKSLALAAPYVDLYPDDVNEALSYGYMAYRLDTILEAVRVKARAHFTRGIRKLPELFLYPEVNAARDSLKASGQSW